MIKIHRVTSNFIQSIPHHVKHFDGILIAEVKTKSDRLAILDPCIFDWNTKTISMNLPENRNDNIEFSDLDDNFYEGLEAAFLVIMNAMA